MPHHERLDYWVRESIRNKTFEEVYTIGKELGRWVRFPKKKTFWKLTYLKIVTFVFNATVLMVNTE